MSSWRRGLLFMTFAETPCPHGMFPLDNRERPFIVWPDELPFFGPLAHDVSIHGSLPASFSTLLTTDPRMS